MTSHDADAVHLLDLDAAFWHLNHANGRRAQEHTLTRAHIDETVAASFAIEAACEAFRRAHYPSRGRVFVGLGEVFTSGRSGRGVRVVFDRERVAS